MVLIFFASFLVSLVHFFSLLIALSIIIALLNNRIAIVRMGFILKAIGISFPLLFAIDFKKSKQGKIFTVAKVGSAITIERAIPKEAKNLIQ